MRLKSTFLSTFLSLIFGLFISCSEDTPEPVAGDIIIVNEGNFGQGNGTISLYNRDNDVVENNVFTESNNGRSLEAGVQSLTVANSTAFIICNATDKIEIADASTLEALRAPLEDPGLVNPRYLAVSGKKAYVSVWGPFDDNFALTDSKVAVIDLQDYSIKKYISVPAGPEGIQVIGEKVFVANSFTNVLTVINTNTEEISSEITLEGSPRLLAERNGELWVSVTGAASEFVQINPSDNTIAQTIDVDGSNSNGKFVLSENQDMLYFIGAEPFPSTNTSIFSLTLNDASANYTTVVSGDHYYGIGSDPLSSDLFVGNSNAFQGEGTVLRYSSDGELQGTYAVGVGPNGFIF